MLFRSVSSRSSLLLKSTVPATLFVSRDMSTSTSASRSLSASKPTPSDSFPEYYQSKPHHSSKSGFQYPPEWGKSSKENNLIEFLKTRFFDWDEEPPLPKMEDRPKVLTPTYKVESKGGQEEDRIRFTSFGHASCHLQIPVPISSSNLSARKYQTITVLTDPVLSKRCSPFQFMGPARYTEAPTTIQGVASVEEGDEVKAWPHIVAISHNHYDHLDYNTIYALANPPEGKSVPHFVCTLGVAQFFKDLGVPVSNISELDWWDSVEITSTSTKDESSKLKITCTPAQHFSGRGLGDRNKSLFGGFAFESLPSQSPSSDEKLAKIYFTGDSGFGYIPKGTKKEDEDSLPKTPLFKEIGENLGPFDLALIPIGAFLPRAFMSTIHMNPSDAVQAHQLVKSKQSYGIHFNVFRLTPEAINEPQKQLLEETKRRGVKEEEFTTIEIGETRAVEIGE